MSYLRTFSGENALKSVGDYASFDFTRIESVTTGDVQLVNHETGQPGPKRKGTTVRSVSGLGIFLEGDDEKNFLAVWEQYVAESQQQERVRGFGSKP